MPCGDQRFRTVDSREAIDPNGVRTDAADVQCNQPDSKQLHASECTPPCVSGPIGGPLSSEKAIADADLEYLTSVWPDVPADLKAKIVGMVRAVREARP